ncbi:MAG: urate hydroxylase PuuD [Woeseiaceae bacterium]|nr:urate hydroxylase PuuD [Woeseiaceae bacterium]
MEAYVVDWLNLLVRWLHFVAGIAWIGSSFYFIWLDNHLESPRDAADNDKGVGGEVWSVHGGGFYHAQKYRVAPAVLPATLHWFKWEAYTTWLSGMFLLGLIYWYGAEIYLVDPAVAALSPGTAVAIAAAFIVFGWLVYDGLCRSPLARSDTALGAVLFLFVALLAWALCQLFGGRGAYIHFGAVLGTIMAANVFFVIIPGQRQMVAAAERGQAPDPAPGIRGKQRSVHNTYFTLPVLFVMLSSHFPVTYGSAYNWAVLIAFTLAGALIRAWFVARHAGSASPWPLVAGATLLVAVAVALAPRGGAAEAGPVGFDEVRSVVREHCSVCHASSPSHPAFPAAPAGFVLDSDAEIRAAADRRHQQAVVTRAMPIGNLTGMSDAERALLDRWYGSLVTD